MAKKRHGSEIAKPGNKTARSVRGHVTKNTDVERSTAKGVRSTVRRISEPSVKPEELRRGTDFKRLDAMTDKDIAEQIASDEDVAPEFTDEMMAQARWVAPVKKVPISFRVDPDVLDFFKADGEGYQSRMNAVLRAFMERKQQRP